jgi:alpha-tubulin suppressor-like RCC1 family protein
MSHQARCYGCGVVGALGDGMNRACGSAPVVLPMTDVVQVVVARSYQYDAFRSATVCARSRTGAVRCWGINDRGQRGVGTTDSIATVSPSASMATDIAGHTFSWITAAESSICGIAEGGRVLCWGERTHYRGFGTDTAQPTPEVITGPSGGMLPDMRQVQCGNFNCCAVSTRNELYCWGTQQIAGSNARVIPGGPATEVVAPTEVRPAGIAPGSIEALGLGSSICVVGRDAGDLTRRVLVCWGDNDSGQSGASPSTASAGFTTVPITGAGF